MVMFHVQAKEVNIVDFVVEAEDNFKSKSIVMNKLNGDDWIEWRFSNYDVIAFEEPVTIDNEE